MNSVNFTITIKASQARTAEILKDTGLSLEEYYEILVKDNLDNVVPKGDNEILEVTFGEKNE